jgi:hypothetical protein
MSHVTVDSLLQCHDESMRAFDLPKLKQKIQNACDAYAEHGQFEVWWQSNRTHTIVPPRVVDPKWTSFQTTAHTYSHNDEFLRGLLRDAQERRTWAQMQRSRNTTSEYYVADTSGTNVDVAWRKLCDCFICDRDSEQWARADWQPTDRTGPHV